MAIPVLRWPSLVRPLPLLLALLPLLLLLAPHAHAFAVRPTALITGGNRGLGRATAELLADVGYHVILTARTEEQGEAAAAALRERGGSAEFFPLDVVNRQQLARLADHLAGHAQLQHKQGVPDVVINNAGVCIREEGDLAAADPGEAVEETNSLRRAYEASLEVNTWGPLRLLTEVCLPRMRRRGYGCVINVSSGDGELAYLHTVAAKRLRVMRSLEELRQYADKVVYKQQPGMVWPLGGIAHLPWPAYCFSKALLNTGTRILHEQEAAAAAAALGPGHPLAGRSRRGERSVRIVALCPGDLATGMCDVDPADALSPHQAALDVVWAALHPQECPGGQFYRAREPIPW